MIFTGITESVPQSANHELSHLGYRPSLAKYLIQVDINAAVGPLLEPSNEYSVAIFEIYCLELLSVLSMAL